MTVTSFYATLDGHRVVPCFDVTEWGKWFASADRHVGIDSINGRIVSTVFLGVNHSFVGLSPLWFETIVFAQGPGDEDEIIGRFETWDEAAHCHHETVSNLKRQA